MKRAKYRVFLFHLIMVFIVIIGLEGIGYLAMVIDSRSQDWVSNKHYFAVRYMLIGDKQPEHLPRYLTLPYLGYIPYPGYAQFGIEQHNKDGYRGTRVPLLKTNKYRVLCLGGSTTYGMGVEQPAQTWPAQLETMLSNYILHDSLLAMKYAGAEVLNAGIEGGNSAEELQQYLFKYRYYKPDAVIVHSGVNDAEQMASSATGFQLDYTNYRRLQFHLEPLPAPARWFMRSYFISYLVIRLFYENFYYSGTTGRQCFTPQRGQTVCNWTTISKDSILQNRQYGFLPFYRNSKTLFEEVIKDSAALIILPNILNISDTSLRGRPEYVWLTNYNLTISDSLCRQAGGISVEFTYDSIQNPAWWIDDCHLNARGERNKAQVLLPYLIELVKSKAGVK